MKLQKNKAQPEYFSSSFYVCALLPKINKCPVRGKHSKNKRHKVAIPSHNVLQAILFCYR